MTRRIDISLDKQVSGKTRFIPQVMKQAEREEMSVEKWSEKVVERMFASATEELEKAD
ncbi:hypothetical protein [Planktotalea arctica]|uniref:hypothetical protein n=1 Tax=Planktotalea arctica TaxID=1481893 RepID=UPI001592B88A|nr:hypothetical protein [Planktotalea arctica]